MIWIYRGHLIQFLNDLNSLSPTIKYTHHHSPEIMDFLDLTIFKSALFPYTNLLDTKTFQRAQNLYHYSSNYDHLPVS